MGDLSARLERARNYLAIAESGDAKREAYRMAAEELAAEREETGATLDFLASKVGTSTPTVSKLLAWRSSGYAAATPFLMDPEATTRAADSHTRRAVRERPEVVAEELARQSAERRAAFAAGLMADPEVAGQVLERPEVRVAVHQADRDREAKLVAGMDRADGALAPVRRAAGNLGSLGWVDEVRALRKHVAWLLEQDADLAPGDVAEARRLLAEVDQDLVVYATMRGYAEAAGPRALGTT